MDIILKQLLNRAIEISKTYSGITAIYSIDIDHTQVEYEILNKSHNKESFKRYIKKIFPIIREKEFDILFIDLNERIVCKKVGSSEIVIITADKELSFGKIFAMIRGIDQLN